jgi:hypothetical protein
MTGAKYHLVPNSSPLDGHSMSGHYVASESQQRDPC